MYNKQDYRESNFDATVHNKQDYRESNFDAMVYKLTHKFVSVICDIINEAM